MESIKEKANGLYPELRTDSDDWDVIEEQCDRDDQRKAFVLGANYVLEVIKDILFRRYSDGGDPKQRWIDMKKLIESLEK